LGHRRRTLLRCCLVAAAGLLAACSGATGSDDAATADGDTTTLPTFSESSADGSADTEPAEGTTVPDDPAGGEELQIIGGPGVLVWVHDAEPPTLHADDPDNSADVTAWLQQGMVEGLFGIDANNAYYPELLAGEPTVEQLNSGTIVISYELRDGLTWSDGTPLTSADVAYTHDIIVEGCEIENDRSIVDATNVGCEFRRGSRFGYELVTDFEVVSDTEFRVTMAAFYGGWRSLYDRVFAAHAFGETARDVNDSLLAWSGPNGILPSSGPLVFDRWDPGLALHLSANERYHGSVSPDATNTSAPSITGVELVFVADADTRIELLLSGEAHILMARAEPGLEALTASDSFTVASSLGPRYEQWSINLLADHLSKPEVREAIAHAIDKTEIVAEIYEPIYGPILPPDGLGNSFWMPNQAAYQDNQAGYGGNDVAAAADALRSAGYLQGADGGWNHPEDGPLVIRAGTTAGVELRDRQLAMIADQLGRAGIEVVIESAPGGLFFTEGPFSPDALAASGSNGAAGNPNLWDIAQFSWTGGPWPGAMTGIYRTGSQSNPYGFASPEYDVAATECDAIVDDGERATCYGELDKFATTLERTEDGLFVIPLTQTPRYFGHGASVVAVGAAPDVVQGGPLVNVGDYQLG
jgi:peptide/nickel transport system substrate-binding protein